MNGLSDSHLSIEDEIAEGDHVVILFAMRGTHDGELMGIPPTSKKVTQTGITIYRLADGKIVWMWQEDSGRELMQQLGVTPPLRPEGG
jgi:predicted ester cyclase